MLSRRLKAIADKVPPGSRVADVGTDHGYIPVYLVQNHISSKVIASDISQGSLSKAINLVETHNLGKMIETRLGAGLKVLEQGEVDTIIIAGMGGLLIKEILEEGYDILEDVETLILQPMNSQSELRRWLIENKFTIIDEDLVIDDGRFYEIVVAEHGQQERWDGIELEISPILLKKKHELLEQFLLQKINAVETLIDRLKDGNTKSSIEKLKECERKLVQYKEVYQCLAQLEK